MYMFLEAFGAVVSLPAGWAGEGFLLLDESFECFGGLDLAV
jgi:hypothetical protein